MITELRHYVPVPGKEADIRRRFAEHTFQLFKNRGMRVERFWETADGSGHLWYTMTWPDQQSMNDAWAAFRADPAWLAVKERSERDRPIVAKIESYVLTDADYFTP